MEGRGSQGAEQNEEEISKLKRPEAVQATGCCCFSSHCWRDPSGCRGLHHPQVFPLSFPPSPCGWASRLHGVGSPVVGETLVGSLLAPSGFVPSQALLSHQSNEEPDPTLGQPNQLPQLSTIPPLLKPLPGSSSASAADCSLSSASRLNPLELDTLRKGPFSCPGICGVSHFCMPKTGNKERNVKIEWGLGDRDETTILQLLNSSHTLLISLFCLLEKIVAELSKLHFPFPRRVT